MMAMAALIAVMFGCTNTYPITIRGLSWERTLMENLLMTTREAPFLCQVMVLC